MKNQFIRNTIILSVLAVVAIFVPAILIQFEIINAYTAQIITLSGINAIMALSVNIICDDKASRMVFVIVEGTALFSYTLILYVRWRLYAGNKVRSRKNRRFH